MTAPFDRVYELIMGAWSSQVVRTLATLGVPEALIDGPATSDQIAATTGCHPGAMQRLLRAGVALGLIEQQTRNAGGRSDSDMYAGAPDLRVLEAAATPSLRAYAMSAIGPAFWLAALELPEAVRTGSPQASAVLGTDVMTWFRRHADQAELFGQAMSGLSGPVIEQAVAVIDPGEARTVCDVGGAEGAFAAALLARSPGLTATVLDQAPMMPAVAEQAARRGLDERLVGQLGDFFTAVPKADVYLLKYILHDWDDDACVRILTVIREQMDASARLYVVEMTSGRDVSTSMSTMDMAMLFATGGQERDLAQFDAIFARAGLRRRLTHALQSSYSCMQVAVT